MDNCIFCKIVKKEIPSTLVYEDSDFLAILDINPVNIGHTLVMPKAHYANLYDTPEDLMCKMMAVIKRLSVAIKKATKADGINIEMNNELTAGQLIAHTHIHIVPRFENDGFKHWKGARGYSEGEAGEVAGEIKSALI